MPATFANFSDRRGLATSAPCTASKTAHSAWLLELFSDFLAFGLIYANAAHGVPLFKDIPKGVIVITIEIDGLHDIAAGETLEVFANGLCIRISVSSPPVLEDVQDVQCIGSDDLLVGGESDAHEKSKE